MPNVLTNPLTTPFTQPLTRALTDPGAGGGLPDTMTFELASGYLYARAPWDATYDIAHRFTLTAVPASSTSNGVVTPSGLADLLLIGCGTLKLRLRASGLLARIQPSLFDGVARIDRDFDPWRKRRALRRGFGQVPAAQGALWC